MRILGQIEKGRHADDLLKAWSPNAGPDRGLCWHLVLGVQRRRGTLDSGLQPLLKRELQSLQAPVHSCLRMGLFEIWFSNTPKHAAVDQAVQACRSVGASRASGLINAVLRRAPSEPTIADPYLDIPAWLSDRWHQHPSWVQSLNQPSPLFGVWNGQHHYSLGEAQVPNSNGVFRLPEGQGAVTDLPGFSDGHWWVMDAGSARCSDTLSAALRPGDSVLDVCAAPGGKSFRLASQGFQVSATDLSDSRLDLLKEGAQRLNLAVSIRQHDWESGRSSDLPQFDGVLVDAPCTALGTIRRRPEIRWHRLPTDPAAMSIRQIRILKNAAEHVKPDGVLAYSVCSPIPEEGKGVVAQLAGWNVVQQWCNIPPQHGEDVFQCFLLKRQAEHHVDTISLGPA